jgi:hypothetical protein
MHIASNQRNIGGFLQILKKLVDFRTSRAIVVVFYNLLHLTVTSIVALTNMGILPVLFRLSKFNYYAVDIYMMRQSYLNI